MSRKTKVWGSNITYIKTDQGWIYLTIILDLFDRKVIGWSISERMSTCATIMPACNHRKIVLPLIFHSDRRVQYACGRFRKKLKAYKLVI